MENEQKDQLNTRLPEFSESAGVVAGLGPEATMRLIELWTADSIIETRSISEAGIRIPIQIAYANVPQGAEALALSGALSGEPLVNILKNVFDTTLNRSFRSLDLSGCTFSWVHCNTLGLVVNAFGLKNEFPNMEVLTIADAMSTEFENLKDNGIEAVFPIGTHMTVNGIPGLPGFDETSNLNGMYDKAILSAGLELIKPNGNEQHAINQAVLGSVQDPGNLMEQFDLINRVVESRQISPDGKVALLICCTDLNRHGDLFRIDGHTVVDTAQSVVRHGIRRMVGSLM